jgi:hypothetical protein
MRYAQLRLSDKEFITVKKAALDAGISLEEFLKSAMAEKLNLEKKEEEKRK